jgi:hypothetical protein
MEEQDDKIEVLSLTDLGINAKELFAEMQTLSVSIELQTDPDTYYIGGKLVEVREAVRRAQTLYLRVQEAKGAAESRLLELETSYEIQQDMALSSDPEVQKGQSANERLALAGNKLVAYKRKIKEAKQVVSMLVTLDRGIQLCNRNLKDTDAAIKSQSKLMEALLFNLKISDKNAARQDPALRHSTEMLDDLDAMADEIMEQEGSSDTVELELEVPSQTEPETKEEATETASPDDLVLEAEESMTDASLEDELELDPGLTGAPQATEEVSEEPIAVVESDDPVITPQEIAEDSDEEEDSGDVMDLFMDDDDSEEDSESEEEEEGEVSFSVAELDDLVESAVETEAKTPKDSPKKASAEEAKTEPVKEEKEPSVDDFLADLGL